jgi:hypothetical protein
MTPPEELKQRVLAAARKNPSPTRAEVRGTTLAGVAVAALGLVLALVVAGGPYHAVDRPGTVGLWVVLGVVSLAVVATWWALPPPRSMLPPPDGRLLAIALGVPVLVGAWLIAWHATYDDPFTRTGFRCFALTLAAAPGPFLALLAAGPRFAPSRPWLAGAAVGAVSGAWSAIVVELWCPLALPAHVAVGHVLPLVALVLVGAALGGPLFRPRRA